MKFTCEKALLVSALSVASRTVAQKSTIPCLEGVLLRAGVALQLTGYNLETGITVHVGAQIQEAGSCVMPARLFFDIVRKLPDEMVSITVDHKQQVSIRAGAAFFQITAMDSEDYPELPDVNGKSGVTMPQSALKAMISGTIFSVSENQARPIQTGCLMEVTEDSVTMVAVDSFRLARRTWHTENAANHTLKFVVPAAGLKEIERILAELSAEAAGHREQIKLDYDVLLQLECIFARARLSFAMRAICPEVRTDGQLNLIRARHPLITGKTVVPISVRLGSDFDTLIITGPNTGGKTVTLKTIGLLTLMAECGLHIPADDGSAINVYEQVFADIGDEQSIEQSLSTFSSHTKNIVEILKVCDKDSLVLFDELCAGTDPAEGAALAISIIEFCRKCGAGVAATTHYAELKLYAMRTSGVMNASCEFNVETLQPTYRLLIGVPGKSNAFAISKRLGIDEAILEQARSLVSQNDVNFEDVLTQLDQQRQEMEKAKEEAERLRRETEKQKEKSDEYYAQIKQEKEKAAQQARKEAQYIIDDARRAADAVYEELKQLRKQAKNGAFVPGSNEKQAQLRRNLNEAESRMQPQHEEKQRPEPTRAIRIGDTVELLKLGTKATVLAINKDGSYQLRAGILQVTAKPEEVYLLENETQNAAKKVIAGKVRELKAAAQPELDIRGMAVDEALPVLDNFLDAAYMGNLPNARIIHGKGTGVLRAAVQDELRRCKYVKSFRLGVYGEGESGVTIVEFK